LEEMGIHTIPHYEGGTGSSREKREADLKWCAPSGGPTATARTNKAAFDEIGSIP